MSSPVIAAIETASRFCSVALLCPDNAVIEYTHQQERGHTNQVLPLLDQCLEKSGLDLEHLSAIAYSKGPGSFTGIRVGVSFAQGLALSNNIPLIAVSSLQTLAQSFIQTGSPDYPCRLIAAFDARMGEVYLACFDWDTEQLEAVCDELLLEAQGLELDSFLSHEKPNILLGSGFTLLNKMTHSQPIDACFHQLEPLASGMIDVAQAQFNVQEFTAADDPVITYLRDNIVQG